jgi:hypothetical protein
MSGDPIEQINRFVITIVAMAIAFGALAIVLLAWGAPGGTIDHIADFAGYLRRHSDRETKLIITLGAVVVVLAMLTVIVVELTPSPNQKMRVRNLRSGDAAITTTEIAQRVNADVLRIVHIAECRSYVSARGRRVDVVLDLHVDAGADLAQAADEACRRAHELIEKQLGIELTGKPRARLHYRELRLGEERPATAPQLPPTGWERPQGTEGDRDERGTADTPQTS